MIIPHQCGATNLIACMGTALSEAHIDILKRMCKTLILALDPDEAGLRAAERGALAATENLPREIVPVPDANGLIRYEERLGAEVRVLLLPEGMDPDELILSDRRLWDKLVADALPVPEFYLERARREIDVSTARGKQEAAERMLSVIAALDSPVQRAHYVQRLAQWIHVDERELTPQLDRIRRQTVTSGSRMRGPTGRRAILRTGRGQAGPEVAVNLSPEEHSLALMIRDPQGAAALIQETGLSEQTFEDPRHREVFRQLLPYMQDSGRQYTLAGLLASLDSESAAQVESLGQRLSDGPPLTEEMVLEDLIKGCTRLRRQEISRRIEELRFVKQEAQDAQDTDAVRDLDDRIARLTAEYLRIDRRFQAATYTGKRHAQSNG